MSKPTIASLTAAPVHLGRPNPERLAAYFAANPGRKSVSPA